MTTTARTDRVLLASSTGGHFTELEIIADALEIPAQDRHWVVPRSTQTETRLASHDQVTYVPTVHSRELTAALRNVGDAVRLHRRLRPRLVISAGAAQAVPHLLAAATHGTPIRYFESVARLDGPSMTGRIAALLPRTALLAPRSGWGGRWKHVDDVFSGFTVTPGRLAPISSAVVALGSERYPFPRAVQAVRQMLGTEMPVTWQVGNTDVAEQPNRWLRPDEMSAAMAAASVVVTHGGVGSILTALQAGKLPVVLPRSPLLGEHCDDHQVQMCQALAARGLIVLVEEGEDLGARHLARAASARVTVSGQAQQNRQPVAEATEPAAAQDVPVVPSPAVPSPAGLSELRLPVRS